MIVPKVSPRGIDWPFQVRAYGKKRQRGQIGTDLCTECQCPCPLAPWEFLIAAGMNQTVRPPLLICYFLVKFPDRYPGVELPIYCNYDFHRISRNGWVALINSCGNPARRILLSILENESKYLLSESLRLAEIAQKFKYIVERFDPSKIAEPQLRRALKR